MTKSSTELHLTSRTRPTLARIVGGLRWLLVVPVLWSTLVAASGQTKSDLSDKTADKSSRPAREQQIVPSQKIPNEKSAKRDDWFSRWVRGQQFYKFRKNAPQVRQAFDDVCAAAAKATVQVLCDHRPRVLGLIVDADGYILTKASELTGVIECQLPGGDVVPAKFIAAEHRNDIGLLQVDAHDLPVAKWRRDGVPTVGSWLIAPAAGSGTLAVGIVSTGTRWIRGGVLGVFLEPSDDGPRVVALNPTGGGGKAGMRRGDIIVRVNGKETNDVDSAIHAIGSYLPGETVKLTIRRDGDLVQLEAKLDSIYQSFNNKRAEFQNALGTALSDRRAGFPHAFEHDLGLLPNQCGGPVVDLSGRVVGLNIARAGRVSSFAVPTAVVTELVAEMRAGKYATKQSVASHGRSRELETVEATSTVKSPDGSH